MTNYKTGDKVLVEAEVIEKFPYNGTELVLIKTLTSTGNLEVSPKYIRPYTPRQEFEYGEIVEVDEYGNGEWIKAKFIGTSHNNLTRFKYFANKISEEEGVSLSYLSAIDCRKINTKKETLTIGGVAYYKDDVEAVTKDLKPIRESK